MNDLAYANRQILRRRASGPWRRIRVLWRLAIRRLLRVELVETDSQGNPKVNPIRWLM